MENHSPKERPPVQRDNLEKAKWLLLICEFMMLIAQIVYFVAELLWK